jgi:hypothetical protein
MWLIINPKLISWLIWPKCFWDVSRLLEIFNFLAFYMQPVSSSSCSEELPAGLCLSRIISFDILLPHIYGFILILWPRPHWGIPSESSLSVSHSNICIHSSCLPCMQCAPQIAVVIFVEVHLKANSHIPCRAPAMLRQCRALHESPRVSRKYPNR